MPHIREMQKNCIFKANLVLFCSKVSYTVQKPSSGKYDVMWMWVYLPSLKIQPPAAHVFQVTDIHKVSVYGIF